MNSNFAKNITTVTFEGDPGSTSSNEKDTTIELPSGLFEIFPNVEKLTILHYDHIILKPENQTWPPNLQKMKITNLEKDRTLPKFVNSNIVELELDKCQFSKIKHGPQTFRR